MARRHAAGKREFVVNLFGRRRMSAHPNTVHVGRLIATSATAQRKALVSERGFYCMKGISLDVRCKSEFAR